MNIAAYRFYSFFTKYSILDDYGFLNGLITRIVKKIVPEYSNTKSFERLIIEKYDTRQLQHFLDNLSADQLAACPHIKSDLELAIASLASKTISFGLDKEIKTKIELLDLDVNLLRTFYNKFSNLNQTNHQNLIVHIDEVKALFSAFRLGKNKIGTSMQLTYKTRLVLQYLTRLRKLVLLHQNVNDSVQWTSLIRDFAEEYRNHRGIRHYLQGHVDLLLLQIVEHTSAKGEKYIAENKSEFWEFFRKSMLGGGLISLFALFKIVIDSQYFSTLNNAILFSLNYALCFILVKHFGGVIATKQPAMTASTIAKKIDTNNDLVIDNISKAVEVIKNVSKTQLISFVGNVIVALPTAMLLLVLLPKIGLESPLNPAKIESLKQTISPTDFINLYYAAIAGVFLAISGFISGFVDNRIVFSRLKGRITEIPLFKKSFSPKPLHSLADKIDKNTGALIGNIVLGILLGSAFLIGHLTPIPFDIRHIAFSASYLGDITLAGNITSYEFMMCFLGVWLIGSVNFLVSFIITLTITFKTRGITLKQIKTLIRQLSVELITAPTDFIFFGKAKTSHHNV